MFVKDVWGLEYFAKKEYEFEYEGIYREVRMGILAPSRVAQSGRICLEK